MWPQIRSGDFQNQDSHRLILGGLFVSLPLSYRNHFFYPSQKVGCVVEGLSYFSYDNGLNQSKYLDDVSDNDTFWFL